MPTPVDLTALAIANVSRAVVFAKDQPPYLSLPALVHCDGTVLTEWELSEEERIRLIRGERIRLWVWTHGDRLQPVALEITDEHKA